MTNQNPLISVVLFCYRQENYIRESLESILAQTYSPLEIVVSDDASPDRTFEIIEEIARAYNGPHRLVLNRNPENMGLAPHVNKALNMAQAEWVVVAAGDDISVPERVAAVAEAVAQNPKLFAVGSNFYRMYDNKDELFIEAPWLPQEVYGRRKLLQLEGAFSSGCALAYHRDCWRLFPPLLDEVIAEDRIFCLRAALLGELLMLEAPLVHYRKHGANLAATILTGYELLPDEDISLRQFLLDIEALRQQGRLSDREARSIGSDLRRYRLCNYYRRRAAQPGWNGLKNLIRSNLYLSPIKDWKLIPSKVAAIVPRILDKLMGR